MRQRTRFCSLVPCFLALLAASPTPAPGQDYGYSPQKFILAGGKAFGWFGQVKYICAPTVVRAQWSDDGAYMLLERHESPVTKNQIRQGISEGHTRPPEPSIGTLLVWNRTQDRLTEVLKYDPRLTKVSELKWVPGATAALACVVEAVPHPATRTVRPRESIVEFDAKTATKKVLVSADGEGSMALWVSPTANVALIAGTDGEGSEALQVYRLYRPGKPFTPLNTPKDFIPVGWTRDGSNLVLSRSIRDAQGKRMLEYQVYEVSTGKSYPYPNPDDLLNGRLKREAFREFQLAIEPGQYTRDLRTSFAFGGVSTGPTSEVFLLPAKRASADRKGKTPALLVTREAEFAAISPAQEAVLYITRGMVLMRELMEMDGAEFEKVERADAMDRAKQVALGMIMYATDYDDRAVPNDEKWQDNVMPYLKNSGVFEGFNYTFGGGLLTDVQDSAKTELGYIAVSGGRVVAFVDGHVEFVPNKADVEAALLRRWAGAER